MYAVVRTGGKQYKVDVGEEMLVEKLDGKVGDKIDLNEVLMLVDKETVKIGTPVVDKAKVECEILSQEKSKKTLVYKFKRRKKYRKLQGHRQEYTRLKVLKIAGA